LKFNPKPNPFVEEAAPCEVDHRAQVAEELVAYVIDFLGPIRRSRQYAHRLNRARRMIPFILDLVEQDMNRHPLGHLDPLDPFLIAVTISYESAWDYTATGARNERGYMQVHGRARKGFSDRELKSPKNQIVAGVRHLRHSLDLCKGDVKGALTMYMSGERCRPYGGFIKKRWDAYQRALLMAQKRRKTHETTCKTDGDGDGSTPTKP
jgi:soluble lytic murein transglycosylase-like protein